MSIFNLGGPLAGFVISKSRREDKPAAEVARPLEKELYPAGARWVPRGSPITICGVDLPDGMVYVGSELSAGGQAEPSLINPSWKAKRSIFDRGEETGSPFGVYSYRELTDTGRLHYLEWLASGRKDPDIDIRHVRIFFCGIERRIFIDLPLDESVAEELPGLQEEIARLRSIYGGRFSPGYMRNLLEILELRNSTAKFYERKIPKQPIDTFLSLPLRLAVAQAASDAVPLPVHVALAWAQYDSRVRRRTPLVRYPEYFDRLFVEKYAEIYGAGIINKPCKNLIDVSFWSISPAIRRGRIDLAGGAKFPAITERDLPFQKIQAVVDACAGELSDYSRHLQSNPEQIGTIQALLFLPEMFWPAKQKAKFAALAERWVDDDFIVLHLDELRRALGVMSPWTPVSFRALIYQLGRWGMQAEPTDIHPDKLQAGVGAIVVFKGKPSTRIDVGIGGKYFEAFFILQLAASVIGSDLARDRRDAIFEKIDGWKGVRPQEKGSLKASFVAATVNDPSVTAIGRKLARLDLDVRAEIAKTIVGLVQLDGAPTPQETRRLEKVYKALGLEGNAVFSDMHSATTHAPRAKSKVKVLARAEKQPDAEVKLDTKRIAELQKDSARVNGILANVFSADDTDVQPAAAPVAKGPLDQVASSSLLGLDAKHSELARQLLAQSRWSRTELAVKASAIGLMLDGAMERINEACFDQFDIPFLEGEDPLDLSPEILEKLGSP